MSYGAGRPLVCVQLAAAALMAAMQPVTVARAEPDDLPAEEPDDRPAEQPTADDASKPDDIASFDPFSIDESSDMASQKIADTEIPDRGAERDDDPRWRAGRHALTARLGAATPTGVIGLEYAHDILEGLALYAGGGLGLAGPQVAAGARAAVLRRGGRAYLAGGGLSFGDAEARQRVSRGGDFVTVLGGGLWLNADNAFELRSQGGWVVRTTVGFGVVIAAASCTYVHEAESGQFANPREESSCTASQRILVWPTIALAVGRGF